MISCNNIIQERSICSDNKYDSLIDNITDIRDYVDGNNYDNKLTQYLEKAPKSICKSLVILGFTPDEIDIIYNSDEKLFKEHDEDDRGMYMRL